MKHDPIQRLWQLKRLSGSDSLTQTPDEETLTLQPGLATRIAARWAQEKTEVGVLWERVAAGSLAIALIVCTSAALLRPKSEPAQDVMLTLFTARQAPDDGFPF